MLQPVNFLVQMKHQVMSLRKRLESQLKQKRILKRSGQIKDYMIIELLSINGGENPMEEYKFRFKTALKACKSDFEMFNKKLEVLKKGCDQLNTKPIEEDNYISPDDGQGESIFDRSRIDESKS